MAKRSHGEGTIVRRSNGTWLAQVSIEGRRVSKTFKLRKEGQDWINTLNGQVKQGLAYNSAKTTVEELANDWMALKATERRVNTIDSYRRMMRLYILPYFGKMKLQELSAARIQQFYSYLQKEGKGRRTIELVHTILHGYLKYAARLGLVAKNWAEGSVVPRPTKNEMQIWDSSQVSQFLQFVNGDVFYRLAFSTGMRRGELLGLQWKDIDWTNGMINVQRQVYRPIEGKYLFQPPKTDRGNRSIRLGQGLLEALRYHYNVTIPKMQSIAGDLWQENDLIFPTSKGTPKDGYNATRDFHNLVARSGLPRIRFHDIRHTCASLLLLHGEPPIRVAAILGQSVQVLLSTYAHYKPDSQETAANLMDAITSPTRIEFPQTSVLQQIATETR